MQGKKAARHCCSSDTRQNVHARTDREIIADYEKGTLAAGLMTALAFGCCLLHWAAM